MRNTISIHLICSIVALLSFAFVKADDPYRFFEWTVSYGTASPTGVSEQVILINGKFPGPNLDCVTNDNIVLNLINKLDEPFLMTWNGIKQRKNSWQDGVLGTNCPIPPNSNYTYNFQAKDQIGTYTYFPSTALHKSSGGFGALNVANREVIAIPYDAPAGEFSLIIGDWYKADDKELKRLLDSGKFLPQPDALLINGATQTTFTGEPGKVYKFRVSNVGMTTSFNFRIQDHKLQVVEIEGSHVQQYIYDAIDVHVGQSLAVLVKLDRPPKDYYIVATSRFTEQLLSVTGTLHYENSQGSAGNPDIQKSGQNQNASAVECGPIPDALDLDEKWSMDQAKSFRWNLTANAARPNPQGSFHYGTVPITKKFLIETSAPIIDGKQRFAVNGISYTQPDTPLKLADAFNISGVFTLDTFPNTPTQAPAKLGTSVVDLAYHDFVEIVFQNNANIMESWHLDGYDFWVIGFGDGKWTEACRKTYNLVDAFTRYTTQVFPKGWTAILVSFDNKGMWNLRSANWDRQYLGQQLYMRVWNNEASLAHEYTIPPNALMCGKAVGRKA